MEIKQDICRRRAFVPEVDGFEEIDRFQVEEIKCVDWPDSYPYLPSVKVALGHTSESILLRFEVSESNARAVCLEPNGPVWEDSCVEFFVRVPGDGHYFNFETNCIGTGLSARRLSRDSYTHFSAVQMSRVIRRSSLPHEITDLKDASWSLELQIPFDLLGLDICPDRLEANFYKCGDKTAVPHFVSWSPILTKTPDFHRPEFFGELLF